MDNDPIVEAIRSWAERERANNPKFILFVGDRSFTIDQIVDHVERDTEEGRMLRKMILKAATDLFFKYRPG